MRIYVSFMRPCLVLSCLKAPLQLPQFMRPGQIHPCRRVHIVLKHQILHRSWIYSTIGRRMNAWKLDDTFMFMIVVVWWYFYDVGPHSFCYLTPTVPSRCLKFPGANITRDLCFAQFYVQVVSFTIRKMILYWKGPQINQAYLQYKYHPMKEWHCQRENLTTKAMMMTLLIFMLITWECIRT